MAHDFEKMKNLVYIHTITVVPEGHNESGSSLFLLQLMLIVSFFPWGEKTAMFYLVCVLMGMGEYRKHII